MNPQWFVVPMESRSERVQVSMCTPKVVVTNVSLSCHLRHLGRFCLNRVRFLALYIL